MTKSPLLQTSKNREIAEKKIVRNFLDKIKILFFFEFFAENVLKTLLRGRKITRKKNRIDFEKFLKYVIFFDFRLPVHHPSPPPPPFRQYRLKYVLYLDFCSYFIKTKKNKKYSKSEISSITPLLQTCKKLTKSPLLQISKNREIAEKKNCAKFFT